VLDRHVQGGRGGIAPHVKVVRRPACKLAAMKGVNMRREVRREEKVTPVVLS
jgi:hypothetical protein